MKHNQSLFLRGKMKFLLMMCLLVAEVVASDTIEDECVFEHRWVTPTVAVGDAAEMKENCSIADCCDNKGCVAVFVNWPSQVGSCFYGFPGSRPWNPPTSMRAYWKVWETADTCAAVPEEADRRTYRSPEESRSSCTAEMIWSGEGDQPKIAYWMNSEEVAQATITCKDGFRAVVERNDRELYSNRKAVLTVSCPEQSWTVENYGSAFTPLVRYQCA